MAKMSYPMAGRTKRRKGSGGGSAARMLPAKYRQIVGEYLRDARLRAGLTQKELGAALGTVFTAVSGVELGRISLPPERAMHYAAHLSLDPKKFGKLLLRYDNPWLYAMIFGDSDEDLKADLNILQNRSPPP